ncbi:MAG: NAD(P)H-hydrate dehydratase [Pseudomonadota bacterium]
MEVLTTAQMARADQAAIAGGTSGFALMKNAGRAVAAIARRMAGSDGGRVVIAAGPGNNGGDGFVAATVLAANGVPTSVVLLGDVGALKGDAALAVQAWQGPVRTPHEGMFSGCSLIVDALFGAGLSREVDGEARALIEAMNASGVPVLAVDLPSGINGDTGAVMGAAVQAAETVTFFRKKPAHLLLPGRRHCGCVHVSDIGIDPDVLGDIKPLTFENAPSMWRGAFPRPEIGGHKYSRGHAVVVSGAIASTGAARLAARGALRAGAGLVTVASPSDALAVNAAALTAIMVREVPDADAFAAMLDDRRIGACVIGPGGGVGEATAAMALAAVRAERGVVLDADALTSFSAAPDRLFLELKFHMRAKVILTPHEGEFRRLFRMIGSKNLDHSKLALARLAATRANAIVLFKGADTVVAAPDGRATISANAPPWLATAGSGDVLAGFIAGLLAQGVDAFEAASIGVWLHGEAATEFGPGLIAEDLPEALPAVLRRLYAAFAA